ncbi:MAG: hypothetical protein WC471_03670 [Candidatus Woesearchaeota archaeon]
MKPTRSDFHVFFTEIENADKYVIIMCRVIIDYLRKGHRLDDSIFCMLYVDENELKEVPINRRFCAYHNAFELLLKHGIIYIDIDYRCHLSR